MILTFDTIPPITSFPRMFIRVGCTDRVAIVITITAYVGIGKHLVVARVITDRAVAAASTREVGLFPAEAAISAYLFESEIPALGRA